MAASSSAGYAVVDGESIMTVSGAQLNRFERLLLTAAAVLGGLLILARVVSIVLLTLSYHTR